MAMRSAIVSTTVGAEGLPVQDGRHLALADSAEAFAETIAALLANPARKEALAKEAFDFVTANYSWQRVGRQFFDACLRAAEKLSTESGRI
jgi:glycosyltransferase involved in cell wall biosynthesis